MSNLFWRAVSAHPAEIAGLEVLCFLAAAARAQQPVGGSGFGSPGLGTGAVGSELCNYGVLGKGNVASTFLESTKGPLVVPIWVR